MLYILNGDGKGKTTSAIGQVIRVLGHNKKVLYLQFLKSTKTGEWSILNELSVKYPLKLGSFGIGSFVINDDDKKKAKKIVKLGIDFLFNETKSNDYFLVVLDELNYCFGLGVVSEEDKGRLLDLFKNQNTYFFITGRNPPKSFLDTADLVSFVKKVKHPFDNGISAKEGIEF